MNENRAKEIISSPVMANVTFNGSNVYMEKVSDAAQTCTVHYMNDPLNKIEVPLNSLVEH
ncbi:MAG TPA: H-type small acid-soluble spore protein [Ruminiclostridium sp.]|nr:H-type small acid-soluble spore protein [Ruminiclostridium sp.]